MSKQNGHFKNRDESQVNPLAELLFEQLNWFFSETNAELTRAANEITHFPEKNPIAYLNAYLDFGAGTDMVVESPSNYERGCSFWGTVCRRKWKIMSPGEKMSFCAVKAREILHLEESTNDMKTTFFVLNENTFGYVEGNTDQPILRLYVLAVSVEKGGNPQDLYNFRVFSNGRARLATNADFDAFLVSRKGYEDRPEYIWDKH